MKRMKALRIFAAVPVMALFGCTTWTNPDIADVGRHADHLTIDQARCKRYANGLAPMPATIQSSSGQYDVRGQVDAYTGNINATVRQRTGAQDLGNGMAQLAAAVQAGKLTEACMRQLGWVQAGSPEEARRRAAASAALGRFVPDTPRPEAVKTWEDAIDAFIRDTAAAGDIDYRVESTKFRRLDYFVKKLANDPDNDVRSMRWFLEEGHRLVRKE